MGLEPGRWPGTSFWHGQDCREGFAESREGLQVAAGTLNSPVSLHGGEWSKGKQAKTTYFTAIRARRRVGVIRLAERAVDGEGDDCSCYMARRVRVGLFG